MLILHFCDFYGIILGMMIRKDPAIATSRERLALASQYLHHWFNGANYSAEEADAFNWYLRGKPRRELDFSPEQAYEAAQEFFAYEMDPWRTTNPAFISLDAETLWERLNVKYYYWLREFRSRPSQEHREVVCSHYEIPDYDNDERERPGYSADDEEREHVSADVSGAQVEEKGKFSARDQFLSLLDPPSVAWLQAEGGMAGALLVRLLMRVHARELSPALAAELLLRVLIHYPIKIPKDLHELRQPLTANICRGYWKAGRKRVLRQNAVAEVLEVSEYQVSTMKDSAPPKAAVTETDVAAALATIEDGFNEEEALLLGRLETALACLTNLEND